MDAPDESHWWKQNSLRAVTLYPWATMDVDSVLADLADRNVNMILVICKESDGRVFYDSDIAPAQVPERDLLAELTAVADYRDLYIVPVILTLCDKYLLDCNPALVQVARDGTEMRYPNVSSEWMHWVCPSHPEVREHLSAMAEELSTYDIDGVRFSHLEFQPVQNDGANYLSCSCDRCVERVKTETGDKDRETWLAERSETNVTLLSDLTDSFTSDQMINLQVEVSTDIEATLHDSHETLGIDLQSLAVYADTISPRTAHIDLDVHPLWIRDITRSLREKIDRPMIPSIRTASSDDSDNRLPPDELHTAIQMALHGGAAGVSLFSAGANIGCLTEAQWDVVEECFEGIEAFAGQ